MKKISKICISSFILLILAVGCKKDYLETKPSNAVPEETIFETTTSINSALEGALKAIFAVGPNARHDNFGQKAVDLEMDLAGTDMVVNLAGYGWFNRSYQYAEWTLIESVNNRTDAIWLFYYDIIKQANTILSVLDGAKGSQTDKDAIKGEMLGLRAYAYYYLINLYQQTYKGNETKPGVPLYLTPAIEGGPRGTVQEVYTQIIADLTIAEPLLAGKTMPTKAHFSVNVIQGFRARVALAMEDWATAAAYAHKAYTTTPGYTLMSTIQYQAGFSQISNPEWIWGSVIPSDQATIYASFFSHIDVATDGYASLGTQKKITKSLYDQINNDDVRKSTFRTPGTGTSSYPDYNQTKHHVPLPGSWAADYIYMRAGEMYLIEAEALARQSKEPEARTLLETLVKARYPAYSAASFSGAALINEILLQRRIELWGEGFGLLDIKRLKTGLNRPTGLGNHGSPSLDPVVYKLPDADPKMVLRIPRREMDNNTSFTPADQNP
jgi:starch-binding outer membrane protein, SusD/RagB family